MDNLTVQINAPYLLQLVSSLEKNNQVSLRNKLCASIINQDALTALDARSCFFEIPNDIYFEVMGALE